MMKRFLILILAVCASLTVEGQIFNVRDIVAADMNKAAGCEGPYRYDAVPLTPSPKGYVPFYISHYGRHGSRYAWNDGTYTTIKRVLEAAAKSGSLTEEGKVFHDRYMAFYREPLINTGDLTELGYRQHAAIAAAMVAHFPEVFIPQGRFLARSSTSPRAIASMASFCTSLQKSAPKVDISMNSLHTNMIVMNPTEAPDELLQKYRSDFKVPAPDNTTTVASRHQDDILDRLFSDRTFLEEIGGRNKFFHELFMLWSGYHNYYDGDLFGNVFTEAELVDFWEAENYRLYLSHSSDRFQMIPLLKDIIEYADSAIAGGSTGADFRFGHDTVLNALIPLLNINGGGFQPDSAADVKYYFQNFNCPKAANLQFVFYKPKKGDGEILFKLLMNESEVTLPQLQAKEGPYYRWADFAAWAEGVIASH